MQNPKDPRGLQEVWQREGEDPINEVRGVLLQEMLAEFKASDQSPEGATFGESFWSAFLDYVDGTRRSPDMQESLTVRFYRDPRIREELGLKLSRGQNLDNILDECIQEMDGKFVLVHEDGLYALLRKKQLPKHDYSGELYDLPLDAYLRSKEHDSTTAKRIHNRFMEHIEGIDPSLVIQPEDGVHMVARGYEYGILTVGSLAFFREEHSIGHIPGLSNETRDSVLEMLETSIAAYKARIHTASKP